MFFSQTEMFIVFRSILMLFRKAASSKNLEKPMVFQCFSTFRFVPLEGKRHPKSIKKSLVFGTEFSKQSLIVLNRRWLFDFVFVSFWDPFWKGFGRLWPSRGHPRLRKLGEISVPKGVSRTSSILGGLGVGFGWVLGGSWVDFWRILGRLGFSWGHVGRFGSSQGCLV